MKRFYQKYLPIALPGVVFAAILYSMMMSQQLTNTFDGLWHQNVLHAGVPELTSGRWMLSFIDNLNMGLHADPMASLAALSLFIIGFCIILELFQVEKKLPGFLCLSLFISSTAVCNTLSYRMTSLGYAFAYVFAVTAVFSAVRIKHPLLAVLTGGISLGLSMACYQAYLSVFCIVAVFYILYLCACPEEMKICSHPSVIGSVLRILGTLLLAAAVYLGGLTLLLKLNDAALSSYNGVGGITLSGVIFGLPQNICKTYHYFGVYFLTDTLKTNRLQYLGGLIIFLVFLALLIIMIGICAWKRNKKHHILFLLPCCLAIPVACSAYMLLAGDKLELQMTAGFAMLMPLSIILVFSCLGTNHALRIFCSLFCAAFLYGNIMQVYFDQEAMYEGRNACQTIASQIISDLKDDDLLDPDYEYFFVGVPARNPYFSVSNLYSCANGYAQMGNFWVSGSCSQLSYHGLINRFMGFNLPMSYRQYEDLVEPYSLTEMPQFPQDGYITLVDEHLVVIKISEHVKYCDYSLY